MRKIKQLVVTLDDGSVEVYNGSGAVHSINTHASPSRDLPKPEDMITVVSAHMLLKKYPPVTDKPNQRGAN